MNNFNSEDNERWEGDLQERESPEPGTLHPLQPLTKNNALATRNSDQLYPTREDFEEKPLAETHDDQPQLKQQMSKEFWEKTYQDLSRGALSEKCFFTFPLFFTNYLQLFTVPNLTEEEVKRFLDEVQAKQFNSIPDGSRPESPIRNSDAFPPTELSQQPGRTSQH